VSDIVLECQSVCHRFGEHGVLHDVNLRVDRGQFLGLVGESGCGKSTLLRAMLGTHPAGGGRVLMNGTPVLAPGRERGIVYQRYSLFPFLTAVQNVAFGAMLDQYGLSGRLLRYFRWRRARREHLRQAAQLLERFGLGGALNRYPAELSGGMCQRVAIAQAIIMRPQILLLDEPFGALDEATREEQHAILGELYQENLQARQKGESPLHTIVLVTHELNEAIKVADRVIALSRFWKRPDGSAAGDDLGATVVYDEPTPPYPRDPVQQGELFRQQRATIRRAAFEKVAHPLGAFVRPRASALGARRPT
jgi:NitT/TauT family transport system ATP-binding protein